MDVIALTKTLGAFDTRNPPGNEATCARYLVDFSLWLSVERQWLQFFAGLALHGRRV